MKIITVMRTKPNEVKIYDGKSMVKVNNIEPMTVIDKLVQILKERKVKNLRTTIQNNGDTIHFYYDR